MLPYTYGEMIDQHLREMRERARVAREIRQLAIIPAWRVSTGRLLVSAGEWLCGCGIDSQVEARAAARVSA